MGDFCYGSILVYPDHWSKLLDAVRGSAVPRLHLSGVDFSALGDEALLVALGCRDLHSLVIRRSYIASNYFITDELLRSCGAKGVRELNIVENHRDTPPKISEDAILDFCFPASTASEDQKLNLVLEDSDVTGMFVARFFEVGMTLVCVYFAQYS